MAKQIGDALVAKVTAESTRCYLMRGMHGSGVALAAARSAHPNVYMCIGYQHAAVFRLQHAIRRSLASANTIPIRILTAGEVSSTPTGKSSTGLEGIPISVLGSNRRCFKGSTRKS